MMTTYTYVAPLFRHTKRLSTKTGTSQACPCLNLLIHILRGGTTFRKKNCTSRLRQRSRSLQSKDMLRQCLPNYIFCPKVWRIPARLILPQRLLLTDTKRERLCCFHPATLRWTLFGQYCLRPRGVILSTYPFHSLPRLLGHDAYITRKNRS